jgi:hypothetical protein
MSRPRNAQSRSIGLAVVIGRRNGKSAYGVQAAFDGTIAWACETGIGLEDFINMTRIGKESHPGVVRFLDAWDALSASEQQARGAADAVCEQIGFTPVELLRIVADVTCRIAMYKAQIIAAISHPHVVAKTVERALTDEGIADRVALHKAMGFLPTPKGSPTTVAIMQNAQTNATARPIVEAPRPEDTIRRLDHRFNESRRLPDTSASAPPEAGRLASVDVFARRGKQEQK